jgi:alkylated DNA repair dioxygenase AlkB
VLTETHNFLPHHGEVFYFPSFLDRSEADKYLESLTKKIQWQQYTIRIFGKSVLQPRLSAWYGDKDYAYSGKSLPASGWTNELLELKEKIESFSGKLFNSVLLNLYRNGNDSMGWHRDNEKELGPDPVIASLSLGAERDFKLRDYLTKKEVVTLQPVHGSLILMQGSTQTFWEHSLPKTKKAKEPRLNLTFRWII